MTTSKGFTFSTSSSQPRQPRTRLQGMLRILPETLTFYPYYRSNTPPSRLHRLNPRKSKKCHDEEYGSAAPPPLHANDDDTTSGNNNRNDVRRRGKVIPNMPLHNNTSTISSSDSTEASFTLFFLVDSTNRQSLSALPAVSSWFQHALQRSTNDGKDVTHDDSSNNNKITENRVICIPNQPLPFESNAHESSSDYPIFHATIQSAMESQSSESIMLHPMLVNTGFYHLPFLHPTRLPLLRLLNATRVPSIIVVNNCSGRIVTQYGWEAVEREYLGTLKQWIDDDEGWVRNRHLVSEIINDDDDDDDRREDKKGCHPTPCHYFESQVVKDWQQGKSGLPLHWYLFSWIL